MSDAKALGESILNSIIAIMLGYHTHHCGNVAECVKKLNKLVRQGGQKNCRSRILALIDYERDAGAEKIVARLIEQLKCEFKWCKFGIYCYDCSEASIPVVLVLFEGGPENVLKRSGFQIDIDLKNLLKSHRLWHVIKSPSSKARRAVERLVELVSKCIT